MARKETITITDDFDGSPAVETVEFSLDGHAYVIDLNSTRASEIRQMFGDYCRHARKAPASERRKSPVHPDRPARTIADRQRAQAIRTWAATRAGRRELGLTASAPISQRGRIPGWIERAYTEAHSPAAV
jgi:Lsr2